MVVTTGVSAGEVLPMDDDAERLLASESARLGCPVADPMRGGPAFERLVAECLA